MQRYGGSQQYNDGGDHHSAQADYGVESISYLVRQDMVLGAVQAFPEVGRNQFPKSWM